MPWGASCLLVKTRVGEHFVEFRGENPPSILHPAHLYGQTAEACGNGERTGQNSEHLTRLPLSPHRIFVAMFCTFCTRLRWAKVHIQQSKLLCMNAKFWQLNWIYPQLPAADIVGWSRNYITAMFLSPALAKVLQHCSETQCVPIAIFKTCFIRNYT